VNTARWHWPCWLVLLLSTASVHAQSGELSLVLPSCPGNEAWQRDVRGLFRLELHVELALRVQTRTDPALPMLAVEQACVVSSAEARLRFRDPRSGVDSVRALSLRDTSPELRARVLALALAEMLRAHWVPAADGGEMAASPAPAATTGAMAEPAVAAAASGAERRAAPTPKHEQAPREREGLPVPAPTPAANAEPASSPQPAATTHTPRDTGFSLSLGPALHVFFRGGSLLYGAELSITWRRFSLGVLGSLGTNRDDVLGRAHYRRVHGFASFELARVLEGEWTWAAAIRGALGGTFGDADAQSIALPSQTADVTYDGSLETWLALHIADGWSAKLRANLGYALGPRYLADGRLLADFSGVFLGLALNLTTAL
jgi:hypothetical protein